MKSYLVVDQGGHGTRAWVVSADGRVHGRARQSVTTQRENDVNGGDRVVVDPIELWSSIEGATTRALAESTKAGTPEVSAVGIATQRSNVLAWRASTGEALTPVVSWQDTRAQRWFSDRTGPRERRWIRDTTGLYPSAHHGGSKLRAILREFAEVREAANQDDLRIGPLAAWIVGRWTGHAAIDAGLAQRTLLWSRASRNWSEEHCAFFELESGWLPDLRSTGNGYGPIPSLGGIPLCAVGGDQPAAAFSQGDPNADEWRVNLGTGAFLLVPLRPAENAGSPTSRLLVSEGYDGPLGRFRFLEGTINGAAIALDGEAARLGFDPADVRELLSGRRSSAMSSDRLPLFLNGYGGLGSPDWDPNFVSRYEGVDPCDGDRIEQLAAVGESIAFLVTRNIDEARVALGREPVKLRVSGGGSRLGWITQAIADLSGVTVEVEDDPEATLRGVANWLVRADGTEFSKAQRGVIQREGDPAESSVLTPDASSDRLDRYRRWTDRMNTLCDAGE